MSIHIEDLTVRFKNGVTAINHANLNIPNGIFGLLGENGAGKTTLMRVLTTVLKPTSGTVTLDGILYSERNYEKIQRKKEQLFGNSKCCNLCCFAVGGTVCLHGIFWRDAEVYSGGKQTAYRGNGKDRCEEF